MIIPEERSLLKNKQFLGVLGFGLACALVGIIIRGVYNGEVNSCIDDAFCTGSQSTLCFDNGYTYCCGGYSGSYTCQGYYNCQIYGSFNQYSDCTGLIVAEWVMFSISAVVLIALIVIAKRHQKNKLQMLAADNVRRQDIIYSDANVRYPPQQQQQQAQPYVVNINESISS